MPRIRTLAAATLLAAAATLLVASPASAHDELIASTPTAGQRLDAAPSKISLQYSAEVMTVGAAVIVADGAGTDWVVGEPTIDQGVVTVALDPRMPVAGYEVRWRVVSSDGHPISGLIPFTIGDATPLERTAAPTDGETATPTAQEIQSTQENEGVFRIALIGAGGALIAVLLFVLVTHFRRRASRTDADDQDAPAETPDVRT